MIIMNSTCISVILWCCLWLYLKLIMLDNEMLFILTHVNSTLFGAIFNILKNKEVI